MRRLVVVVSMHVISNAVLVPTISDSKNLGKTPRATWRAFARGGHPAGERASLRSVLLYTRVVQGQSHWPSLDTYRQQVLDYPGIALRRLPEVERYAPKRMQTDADVPT